MGCRARERGELLLRTTQLVIDLALRLLNPWANAVDLRQYGILEGAALPTTGQWSHQTASLASPPDSAFAAV
jgi:hypothetical protein